MDWDELLALITLGAVAPYVAEAAIYWIKHHNKFPIHTNKLPQ